MWLILNFWKQGDIIAIIGTDKYIIFTSLIFLLCEYVYSYTYTYIF